MSRKRATAAGSGTITGIDSGDRMVRMMDLATEHKHCPTCECNDSSSFRLLNIRIAALTGEFFRRNPISEALRSRLPEHAPRYCFGFTGFKAAPHNTVICGQFLVCVRTNDKFGGWWIEADQQRVPVRRRHAYVSTVRPDCVIAGGLAEPPLAPRAIEFSVGDLFEIRNSPYLEDLMSWSDVVGDGALLGYISLHLKPLVRWAEDVVAAADKEAA